MSDLRSFHLDVRLLAMRENAKQGRDPTAADETLACLLTWARDHGAERVLEIGSAEGLTSVALLTANKAATLTAIEFDSARAETSRKNYRLFGVSERVVLHEGDAGEILPMLTGAYDMIFLDGPKVQYLKYLPDCKRLLKRGGALFSDDILLFGWVRGEPPKKRRMLVEHIREYLAALESDSEFKTEILEFGEGLALSVKV